MQPLRSPPLDVLRQFLPPDFPGAAENCPFRAPASPGLSGAALWQVTAGSQSWCLKGIPRDQVDFDRQRGLHRLLHTVATAGVPQVAVPHRGRNGCTLYESAGRIWQWEPWLAGEADGTARPSSARIASALRCLATWHLAARSFLPEASESPWFRSADREPAPGIADRLTALSRWTSGTLSDETRKALCRRPAELQTAALPILMSLRESGPLLREELRSALSWKTALQPCLRDIWRPHVLFSDDSVTGLVDPQACRTESVAADISRLLGSLCENDGTGWQAGLQAYASVRPLTEVERILIRTYDRASCLLSGLWWVERLTAPPGDPTTDPLARRGTERLEHFSRRLRHGLPDCVPV